MLLTNSRSIRDVILFPLLRLKSRLPKLALLTTDAGRLKLPLTVHHPANYPMYTTGPPENRNGNPLRRDKPA